MAAWMNRMRDAFGASFLWLVSFIYFTQGFRSFVWTAVSYQLKDILKLSPSASQFVVSVAFFPWSIKPVYGILSDCIPIGGRKRVPYLIIATILSLFPWIILGVISSLRNSHNFLTIFLTLQNFGSAMADVVIDAMIAEAVRSERAAFAGDLQSLSWLAMAFGGICGSLMGGFLLSNIEIGNIFLLFSILPTIQLLSCALVDEISSSRRNDSTILKDFDIQSDDGFRMNKGLHMTLDKVQNKNVQGNDDALHNGHGALDESLNYGTCRRGKNKNKNGRGKRGSKKFRTVDEKIKTPGLRWFVSLKSAFHSLCNAFRQPIILRLAHIGLAILIIFDIILVLRLNVSFGISDKYIVLCGSALSDTINQFKMMPFLVLSGQLCPPGIEGTLFALFMSINNFGSTIGSFFGATLASLLNISSQNFDNLVFSICVQFITTLIPILFLFLIPKEATGVSS